MHLPAVKTISEKFPDVDVHFFTTWADEMRATNGRIKIHKIFATSDYDFLADQLFSSTGDVVKLVKLPQNQKHTLFLLTPEMQHPTARKMNFTNTTMHCNVSLSIAAGFHMIDNSTMFPAVDTGEQIWMQPEPVFQRLEQLFEQFPYLHRLYFSLVVNGWKFDKDGSIGIYFAPTSRPKLDQHDINLAAVPRKNSRIFPRPFVFLNLNASSDKSSLHAQYPTAFSTIIEGPL